MVWRNERLPRTHLERGNCTEEWSEGILVDCRVWLSAFLSSSLLERPLSPNLWNAPRWRYHEHREEGQDTASLLDLIIPAFQEKFTPGQHIAIDELFISFKWRANRGQYLKGKPHLWGIKAFVSYLYDFSIYYGNDTDLVRPELSHTRSCGNSYWGIEARFTQPPCFS